MICPFAFNCTTAFGIALVETALSMNVPNLFPKKLLTANWVETLLFSGPPTSSSPSCTLVENSSTATPPESESLILASSPIVTLLLKIMLPVLLNAVI